MVCRIKKLFLVWTLLLAFFAQSFAAVLPAFAEELYSEGTVDITGGSCLDPIAEGYATGQSALAYTDEIGIKKVYIRKSGESFTAGEIIIQRHLDGQTTIIRREPIKQDGTYLIPFLEDGQYSVCALPYDGTKYSTSHAFSFQVINGVMSPDTPLIVLDIEEYPTEGFQLKALVNVPDEIGLDYNRLSVDVQPVGHDSRIFSYRIYGTYVFVSRLAPGTYSIRAFYKTDIYGPSEARIFEIGEDGNASPDSLVLEPTRHVKADETPAPAPSIPEGGKDNGANVTAVDYKTFDDLEGAYAKDMIEELASKGFYDWIEGTSFNPNRSITRAEFIYLLITALDLNAQFDSNFSDVKPGDYYYNAIGTAKAMGITSGVGNNRVGADQGITRQDMATILVRALKAAGKDYPEGSIEDLNAFDDAHLIAEYAKTSLATLVKAKILQGYNRILDPNGSFTMQHAAVVIYKIYNR